MYCVTKATSFCFIDCKCHSYKAMKSHKSCLTNYTQSILHHIMLLVNAFKGRHTATHTYVPTYEPKKCQETRHMPACSQHAWFKKWPNDNLITVACATALVCYSYVAIYNIEKTVSTWLQLDISSWLFNLVVGLAITNLLYSEVLKPSILLVFIQHSSFN